jgi:chromate transporter
MHKIAAGALVKDGSVDWILMILSAFALSLVLFLRVNFFICLLIVPALNVGIRVRMYWQCALTMLVGLAVYILYVLWIGYPASSNFGINFGPPNVWSCFVLGMVACLVSVGGAFSAVPFLKQSGELAGWITPVQILQGLALVNVVPAPMVIIATFIGFIADSWVGALMMTLGMFLPAFFFPIAGHNILQKLMNYSRAPELLDGVLAAVLGTILMTSFDFIKSAVVSPITAALFVLFLGALYTFNHPASAPLLLFAAVVAGQVLLL